VRITESMRISAAIEATRVSGESLFNASTVASSGLRVQKPSDDPTAWAAAARDDGQIATLSAQKTAVGSASSDLSIADSALASANDLMGSASTLAVQMANGSMSASDRAAASKTVDAIRQQLFGIANTKGQDGYLFGGTASGAAPFDPTTGAFNGNGSSKTIDIGNGHVIGVSASGANAFTAAGGRDVFADLAALSTALATNNTTGISTAIAQLEQDRSQIDGARTDIGSTIDRLNSAGDVLTRVIDLVQGSKASSVEADAAKAISDLQAAQTAYQRAVDVSKQILQMSSVLGSGG
jgi:flagellar hook-associated protein 3 FlgL